jgi:hypothetical protein
MLSRRDGARIDPHGRTRRKKIPRGAGGEIGANKTPAPKSRRLGIEQKQPKLLLFLAGFLGLFGRFFLCHENFLGRNRAQRTKIFPVPEYFCALRSGRFRANFAPARTRGGNFQRS